MLSIIVQKIGDYEIICGTDRPIVDPLKTQKKAAKYLAQKHDLRALIVQKEYEALVEVQAEYKDYCARKPVYFPPRHGEEFVSDLEGRILKDLLRRLSPYEVLTTSLEVLPNLIGVVYFYKSDYGWHGAQIKSIGAEKPADSFYAHELNDTQIAEITAACKYE